MVPPKETHDELLARAARAKIAAGQRTNREERSALNRVERAEERANLWKSLQSVPKGVYEEMSGRQNKTLNEQADAYGVPVAGSVVDVTAVVRWIHDLFGKHGQKLVPLIGVRAKPGMDFDDPLMNGPVSEDGDGELWLARYREKKTRLAELELQQKEGTLVAKAEIREVLDRSAGVISRLIEDLERKFGPDAADLAEKAFDGLQREISSSFGDRGAA